MCGEGIHSTANGEIHFWLSENIIRDRFTLVFLPGLTADHRLFERQIGYFQSRYNVLVWDAPGHAASWPFELSFSLMDEARWLEEILRAQGVEHPVLIGQSMGGYVAQAYCELYPTESRALWLSTPHRCKGAIPPALRSGF